MSKPQRTTFIEKHGLWSDEQRRLAAEVAMEERAMKDKLRKAGVHIGLHGCVCYVSRAAALDVIVAGVLGEKLRRTRTRKRGR